MKIVRCFLTSMVLLACSESGTPMLAAAEAQPAVENWQPAQASSEFAALRPAAESMIVASYAGIGQRLADLKASAHRQQDLGSELALWRRLARIPGEIMPAAELPTPPNFSPELFVELDTQYQNSRFAADQQLAEFYAPLRRKIDQGLSAALAASQAAEAQKWWLLLQLVPPAWSDNLVAEPFHPKDGYDRSKALPIATLPMQLEVTMAPGSHDLHIGICGFDGEDITEIYIGGWFGHISGIRPAPGGPDRATWDHHNKEKPNLADPAAMLSDFTTGTAFGSSLPTTFRVSVSACGIVVARLERGIFKPFLRTQELFNRPTALVFNGGGTHYALTAVRTAPSTTWSDQTKVRHQDKPAETNF